MNTTGFELREGATLSAANAEKRMLVLGCPPEMAKRAAHAHEVRTAKRMTLDTPARPALCNLDQVRDDINRARLADVAKLVKADKDAGRI